MPSIYNLKVGRPVLSPYLVDNTEAWYLYSDGSLQGHSNPIAQLSWTKTSIYLKHNEAWKIQCL